MSDNLDFIPEKKKIRDTEFYPRLVETEGIQENSTIFNFSIDVTYLYKVCVMSDDAVMYRIGGKSRMPSFLCRKESLTVGKTILKCRLLIKNTLK